VIIRLPSSRASLKVRLSPIDVTLAAAAPLMALYLRNVELVSDGDWTVAASYSLVSLVFSLIAFQVFGISETIPRYISVSDILDVAKAVLGGALMTASVLFSVTRLDGIPRSVPAIHALILVTALVAYRGLAKLADRRGGADRPRPTASENVILIGLNDWSVLVMKFLKAHTPERWRVIALLDEETRWIGRSVNGVPVFGPPAYLEPVIEGFAMHGVCTDRVVVGGETGELSKEALAQVQGVCARRDLDLVFLPDLLALGSARRAGHSVPRNTDPLPSSRLLPDIPLSPYLRFKRVIDAVAAAVLILWLLPLLVIAGILVFLDVGSPVLFWQRRIGRGGRELRIYKLRTLRPPFNRRGQRIPEEQRLSWIGRVLRQTRIDELPQLLNVLVGDMSLIGPRPLLQQDQPLNSAMRLTVRPGITGWAQVNGGAILSAAEKEALDVWYIRNASPWLDLRILGMTLVSLLKGDRRSEKVLAQAHRMEAQHLQARQAGRDEQGLNQAAASRFPTAVAAPSQDGVHEAVPMQSR
jgi:lipopolysaccharide/colanic/teichoic acid biosynthesis glycosyltransferase